jgi:hypothetical protein
MYLPKFAAKWNFFYYKNTLLEHSNTKSNIFFATVSTEDAINLKVAATYLLSRYLREQFIVILSLIFILSSMCILCSQLEKPVPKK